MVDLQRAELVALCERACLGSGASPEQAAVLAEATVEAELRGRPPVGLSHLLDHLDAFRTGRIRAVETPSVAQPTAVITRVDCRGGLAQHGFDLAKDHLYRAAATHGLAAMAIGGCFTVGELDYYVRRVNGQDLVGLACANSPALMSVAGAPAPILGTNPVAFGVPLPHQRRLRFDQASSATAWVSVRDAAERDDPLPVGWAVDGAAAPTTSARAALEGALLPFGGYKGGNIALMAEVLATLAGGFFSVDAPPFDRGADSPSVGMMVIALSTRAFHPSYVDRLVERLTTWRDKFGADPDVWADRGERPSSPVPDEVHQQLLAAADAAERGDRTHTDP